MAWRRSTSAHHVSPPFGWVCDSKSGSSVEEQQEGLTLSPGPRPDTRRPCLYPTGTQTQNWIRTLIQAGVPTLTLTSTQIQTLTQTHI